MTPKLAFVEIRSPHWRGCNLWIPLFLLWIPLILLSPILLLGVLVFCLATRINPLRAIAVFWAISCSLPGIDVRVRAQANHVAVRIV